MLPRPTVGRRNDVAPAFSGNDAPQILSEQNFDVAIFGLKLKDGVAALDSEWGAGDGREADAYSTLPQLCDIEELLEKIREALSARR